MGPASYVVTASSLRPTKPGNSMHKYADDTYLVVPASNSMTCVEEIDSVERWAEEHNLLLNRTKSVEIVFVSPTSKRSVVVPQLVVPGFT